MTTTQVVAVLLLAGSPAFAQSPFDGTWVRNYAKSDVPSSELKLQDAGRGAIRIFNGYDMGTLKTDGTKTSTGEGDETAVEKVSKNSYHLTNWTNAEEMSEADFMLSDAGKTLTLHEWDTNPKSGHSDTTTVFRRVSGGAGLIGGWKRVSVKDKEPRTWIVKLSAHEVTWTEPGINLTVRAATNGTPVHPRGPGIPESMTMAYTKEGPRAIHMVSKVAGKTVLTVTYSISEDGKTMYVQAKDENGQPTKGVWDKQR